jgi:hypothetical protein
MNNLSSENIYLKFLNLRYSSAKLTLPDPIDLLSLEIFNVIGLSNFKGNKVKITELMSMAHIGSPATIHRKIKILRDLKLVNSIFQGNDRRSKYLIPSAKGSKYFKTLDMLMLKSALTH